ncbi:uncharacterized protein [Dermacentor albipictus]|uniref:uncharacterized protein isoform X4 n=1 Tax=Dermacentor albipictus TaxID=60249 RepID=UPI0038FD352A
MGSEGTAAFIGTCHILLGSLCSMKRSQVVHPCLLSWLSQGARLSWYWFIFVQFGPAKMMEQDWLLPPRGREASLRDHCAWARRTPQASVTMPPPSSHRHNCVAKEVLKGRIPHWTGGDDASRGGPGLPLSSG